MSLRPRNRGWLLSEMLVALVVGVVVLGALWTMVRSALGGGQVVAARAEALDVARTVWVVLEEELGVAVAGRDWILDADGAIDLRAFRGFGRVCSSDGGLLFVGYRGQRPPDPDRDSLLVLMVDGRWATSSFTLVSSPGRCDPVEGERELGLSGPYLADGTPILVRIFERGSYHLADGAFRYRRGGGGRQPLTPVRLAEGSGFQATEDGVVANVELDGGSGIGPFSWRLPIEGAR